ncbi:MAG: molybdenum ABC transporter ATP-binding protein [Phycisphaerales bacterium]|nr:MAG: molybdenum ABC transporter ATP-binding protein [Phycisphaerales bacterium]
MTIEARFHINRGGFTLDVDLSVPARGVTGLFGPSGCGKTSLLRAIAGLEYHRDGFLKVDDTIWQDAERFVPPHRRSLGYVFQEASLFTHLTVRGNLEYGLRRVPRAERRIPFNNAIELLGIRHLLERRSDTLSGGERQRVAIARALAVSPGLLLMDEPLAALDLASRQGLLPYIESLHDELEIPAIYVSHTLEEIARLADHLILLEAGRVVATGAVNEMLTRLDLPLAHGSGAASIVEAVVVGHDQEYHLTHLDFVGGRFIVPRRAVPTGGHVRLRLAARDVSLTLERQSQTSIQNIFAATVDQVIPEGKAQVMVRLLVADVPILSRITQKSAVELNLKPGKSVYAQVKSVTLLA